MAQPGDKCEHYVEQAARATVDARRTDVRGDRLQHVVFGGSGANRALRLHRQRCVDACHRYAARARTRDIAVTNRCGHYDPQLSPSVLIINAVTSLDYYKFAYTVITVIDYF